MLYIFWLSILIPIYAVIGYPILLSVIALFYKKTSYSMQDNLPISIIIAAHNEEKNITNKIVSILNQSYQTEKLQIIIASDGSTDQTVRLAQAFDNPCITVLDLPRAGKTSTLNTAIGYAENDIVVFTDADNQWEVSTLEHLLRPFSSTDVGASAGQMIIPNSGKSLSIGDSLYRHYESWIRAVENKTGCMVSADGALLALRKELFQTIPLDVNDDFFLSTCAPANGKKIIYVENAKVIDEGVDEVDKQYRRRIRVTVGGLKSLAARRELLNPFKHKLYAIALISHKLIRRLSPLCLIPLLISNFFIRDIHIFYACTLYLQLISYGLAIAGLLDSQGRLPKFFRIAGYILITLIGMTVGCWEFLTGKKYSLWNPQQNR